MVLRKTLVWSLIALCAFPHPARGDDFTSSNAARTLHVYPSNHGFLHQTGQHVPYGWAAMYRIHSPGYFIEGQDNGGEALEPGTYQYVFSFSILPGQHGGLLSKANDVVRIEAWDSTVHERLMSRTFQVSDFLPVSRRYVIKTLAFSTYRRHGHRFEPRIYWQGLSGIFLQKILLQRLRDVSPQDLQIKAEKFERAMGEMYLDRGFVVCRRLNGKPEDIGDAAIWTGLYAASQAWRYKETRSPEALARMEDSLHALHHLYVMAPRKGTLVRYIYPDGQIYPQAASKDTYTGFFFAVTHCLPVMKNRALKRALLQDVEGLAAHFLDNDLAFIPEKGHDVNLNPSFSPAQLAQGLEDLRYDDRTRHKAIRILEAINFYFILHAQRPWPELPRMIRHLKNKDFDAVHKDAIPFLNGALRALQQLQRNVHKSAVLWRWNDAPYQKLDQLLRQMIEQLPASSSLSIHSPDELKFLASHSLHALHFLKMAGTLLPKPNRYQAYYKENLWQNKSLLKTVVQWNGIDEELVAAVAGHSQMMAVGTSSGHLSYLALFDLILNEKDPEIRKVYQSIFERKYKNDQAGYNAMLHVMQPILNIPPEQSGLALWSLTLYSENRRGKGEVYWQSNRAALAKRYGGEISGKARDPLPVNERQRDPFIWQRSPHSLRGDDGSMMYPPLDYLFVYWLARYHNLIS